jgi:hypothetical protein
VRKVAFENFGFKAGFEISGKQLVTFNAAHLTKAFFEKYVCKFRLNNTIVDGIEVRTSTFGHAYVYRSQN